MKTALVFIMITCTGYFLAIFKGPFWGLLAYANIYFNTPDQKFNWWASYIPDLRWSLISSAVLLISLIIYRDKLSKHKFRSAHWMFVFSLLTIIITYTRAVHPEDAKIHTYMLVTFCITVFFIIKSLPKFEQLRGFLLSIIVFSGILSLRAFLEGKRIHARLENFGPSDAFSSNEFGILLASIIPLLIPFLLRGKWYERAICILALPFLLNAFILCNSRGAFVSFVFSIFYVFCLVANKKVKKYLLIAAILVVPLMLYLSDTYFIERISTLWKYDLNAEESLNKLSTGRIEIWRHSLDMAKDYPLGAGPDGFRELSRFYMPVEILTFHDGADYGVRSAHNSYLQVLVEQGILGLCIFLIICFYTMYLLWRSAQKTKAMNMSGTFLDLCCVSFNMSFACSMMGGLFGSQVYYEFFWWQVALSIVTYSFIDNIDMDNESSESPMDLAQVSQFISKESKITNYFNAH
ncbi:MAG: O-antigen ligase family protein [bacterium]